MVDINIILTDVLKLVGTRTNVLCTIYGIIQLDCIRKIISTGLMIIIYKISNIYVDYR